MNNTDKSETGVTLPEDNIIDVSWARQALANVDLFSASLLAYGRGEVMFMLKSNLSVTGYEQALSELQYTVETAETYIVYLQKKAVIEAIRDKFYVALSISSAQLIPDSIEEALIICDIVVAKHGRITADNIKKALEDTGAPVKKMSNAAITSEAAKKKALHDWLLDEHAMSDDDIYQASSIDTSGKGEYLEKMLQAYTLLENWKDFYDIIAEPVHQSDNMKALRFLSDMHDASASIAEYLESEKAFNNLVQLKATFENTIYPKLQFDKES